MSDKEYLESVENFFNDRLKSQVKKKYTHCEGCEQIKEFIIKKDKLIYSCGAKSGKCGPQVIITLPKYLYYPETKSDCKHIIDYYLDKSQLKDIFSSDEIHKQEDIVKQNKELYKKTRSIFIQQNEFKLRKKHIQKVHKDRINRKKDQSILLHKLQQEDDPEKRTKLMIEYLQYTQQSKEDYHELINSSKDINNFITIEPGDVISKK